jgi:hypothetical protein
MKSFRFIMVICLCMGCFFQTARADKLLIAMDLSQSDHLKAYGIAFWALEQNQPVEWLLNYRGGSFLIDASDALILETRVRAVSFELISDLQT